MAKQLQGPLWKIDDANHNLKMQEYPTIQSHEIKKQEQKIQNLKQNGLGYAIQQKYA